MLFFELNTGPRRHSSVQKQIEAYVKQVLNTHCDLKSQMSTSGFLIRITCLTHEGCFGAKFYLWQFVSHSLPMQL